MSWILVAHHDEDMRRLIVRKVRQTWGPADWRTEQVGNVASAAVLARETGFGDCALLVIGSTTPEDAASSVGMSGRDPALYLLWEIKARWPLLPTIVLSNTPDDRLADFLYPYQLTSLVTADADLSDTLVSRLTAMRADGAPPQGSRAQPIQIPFKEPAPAVRALLGRVAAGSVSIDGAVAPSEATPSIGTAPGARLHLDIRLGKDRSAPWQLSRVGTNAFAKSGVLVLDDEQLDQVLMASKRVEDYVADDNPRWLEEMGLLSNSLRKLLFHGSMPNTGCWETFLKHRERVGGTANTRVRVTLDEATHPILVEALRDQVAEDDEYWMLNAPLFRRYVVSGPDPGLFADDMAGGKPINCLVIEADSRSSEEVDDEARDEEFEALPRVHDEALHIARTLRASAGGHVERMQIGRTGGDVRQRLLTKLREREWHVVHFCGHVSGGATDTPGLVLRAHPDGILPVTQLLAQLSRTQLLFLSSCRSGSAQIVINAMERFVPMVVGFRWVVNDARAAEFAKDFYRLLFDRTDTTCYRSIEYTFVRARKAAYERDKERISAAMAKRRIEKNGNARSRLDKHPRLNPDPSWAAPLLVIQSGS